MSSRAVAALPILLVLAASPLAAQDGAEGETIDILVDTTPEASGPQFEDCSDEQDAAEISGEIVVCRQRRDQSQFRVSSDKDAELRYAEQTQGMKTPDLFGIPNHGVVVARGCFIPPCPPPPAYFIDYDELPDTPPGSDADRIAHGLPPLGRDAATPTGDRQARADELGLPPPPDFDEVAAGVSPSGSASQGEQR